jgi:V/A-type H+/Na+-transporting ATPase subunit A
VQLLGTDSLAAGDQVVLESGRLLRENFLQQSAFDETDAYCPLAKQHAMLGVVQSAHEAMTAAVDRGVAIDAVSTVAALSELARMRAWPDDEVDGRAGATIERVRTELEEL